ncbi:MAG: ubiquinol-cytochrome c reductase iron-sulfur subunit [Acidobacteriota bacterium]
MENEKTEDKKGISRRSFLSVFGLTGFTLSGIFAAFTSLKFFKPSVDYGPPKSFRAGKPEDFKVGTKVVYESDKVVVIHDKQGFAAISLVCTHLGCTVRTSYAGFECPCHGSQFNEMGKSTGGPAPRPLEWYRVSLAPTGELEIDKSSKIPGETFFKA